MQFPSSFSAYNLDIFGINNPFIALVIVYAYPSIVVTIPNTAIADELATTPKTDGVILNINLCAKVLTVTHIEKENMSLYNFLSTNLKLTFTGVIYIS